MALARVVYTQSVAGNKNFTVPFPYISRDHVKVTVNGAPASFTWLNTNTVQIDPAPEVGGVVEIRRVTERRYLLVDFKDGSTITETDLDLLALQNFYLSQEADDLAEESNGIANAAASTANNAIAIANDASSASASAVATANSAKATANTALANSNNAVSTANNALSIANTASSNASAAVATANAAQTAANSAVSTANSAKDTANSALSKATTAVSTANTATQNSETALSKANTALANSETAISTANTALTRAASAEVAATAASNAAQSAAANAATAVGTAQQLETVVNEVLESVQQIAGADLSDFTKNSDNLAYLTDKAAARANLGLGNVDNTSDLDKPVSLATQAALATKADVGHTHHVGEVTGLDSANAGTATKLQTARIFTIGNASKSFDGSANVSWSLDEIGATNANGDYIVRDTRDEGTPTNIGNLGVRYEFKRNATDDLKDGGEFHGVMTFQPWFDPSGGNTHQLGFTANGNLWYRTAPIGGTWGPWHKFYHSGNISSANVGTATKLRTPRTFTIGNASKSFDGSANVSWSLDEIGAARLGILPGGVNLNTVVAPGFYRLDSAPANEPGGVQYGQLIVARGGGDTILQIVTGHDNGEIYWRQGNPPEAGGPAGGSWSAWYRFYHSGNLGGLLSSSGYQKLPGGLIIQWGVVRCSAYGPVNWTYPIAFPNQILCVGPLGVFADSPQLANVGAPTLSHVPVNSWNTDDSRSDNYVVMLAIGC